MRAGKLLQRVDPQVRARLEAYRELVGPLGLSGITDIPERRRRQAELSALVSRESRPVGVAVADLLVPEGGRPPVRLRLYRPDGAGTSAPCVLHVHGGGLVSGSVDGDDGKAAALARDTGCVVASVEYRLAPEHPFPAAFDDCVAALRWLSDAAADLGVDPQRIALHGPSAGGNLAVATALHARDTGGPPVAALVLVSPMLDDRPTSPSARLNTGFGAWSREADDQAWQAYLGDLAGGEEVPPYAAPARAGDLAGLPPTFLETGELDLFRDDCLDLARRLMEAGVPVELHVHPGAVHGGDTLAPAADLTRRARSLRVDALRRALVARTPAG